jgi:hypothetical protein
MDFGSEQKLLDQPRPGIKATLERSKQAEKDWPAALIPPGLLLLFLILPIVTV